MPNWLLRLLPTRNALNRLLTPILSWFYDPDHNRHFPASRGLRLKAVGNALHVNPARCCPPDLVPVLRAHKPHLLSLLQLPFVMVDSKALGVPLFFCEDEATKVALVEAGADPWSIYTKDELRILVANNRAKPFLPDELCKLHEIKKTFHGRIAT